jgi:L-asparaginase II
MSDPHPDPGPGYEPVFELARGGVVESVHYGAIAVVNTRGDLVASYGYSDTVTYLRSTAKPFQALPLIENDGQGKYGLTMREIALICASHSGTDDHVDVVESIQAKTGVSEAELLCGTHPPLYRATADVLRERGEEPSPNRHNCSGKHTGMLAFARLEAGGKPSEKPVYIDPNHRIQKDILNTFSAMCNLSPGQVEVGIDGCSTPNYAVPLRNSALAYARLSDPGELPAERASACKTITKAMTTHPDMVGGPGHFDTVLMSCSDGGIVCKGGAEGYQGIGIMPNVIGDGSPALGIALKISDGDLRGRALPAVALEVLRQLGVQLDYEEESLAKFGPIFPVKNWRKLIVGQGRPNFDLEISE